MQTEQPSTYVHSLARWVRAHEAALSGAAAVAGPSSSSSSASSALGWLAAPGAWLGLDYLASSSAPLPPRGPAAPPRTPQRAAAARPTPLPLSTHHLYYLLLHFDSLALPTGDLAQTLSPAQRARPVSFAYVPATPSRGGIDADARSIAASVATTALSAVTFGAAGWWREKEDPMRDGRYLYSALTKIPSLSLSPPPVRLLAGFEDAPGTSLVPLDVFKTLAVLSTSDVDVRTLAGWDRLACQLRSLSLRRCGVEDVEEVLCGNVRRDARRRRGAKDRLAHDEEEEQMPTLAWHFLAHLSLASNNLTFFPSEPLVHLAALVSLDLSSNLLNSVPPSLSSLRHLASLNLADNLIDSLLGIPDALPAIQSLNLSANRLSSLCGLERLSTLRRIDLRRNDVYEVAEVGRLAPLPHVCEIWIKGNPLEEEEDEPRIAIFAVFAQEGREIEQLKIDDEAPGFWERQRVTNGVASRSSRRGEREETPSAESPPHTPAASSDDAAAQAASSAPRVVSVHHVVPAAAQKAQKRRARRVVHLHDDAASSTQQARPAASAAAEADETAREEQARRALREEVTDAQSIVAAAREGRLGEAMGQREEEANASVHAKSTPDAVPRGGASTASKSQAIAGPAASASADAVIVDGVNAAPAPSSDASHPPAPSSPRTTTSHSARPANPRAPLSGTLTRKAGAAAALLSSDYETSASPTPARDAAASSPTRPRPQRAGSSNSHTQTLGRSNTLRAPPAARGDEAAAAVAQRRPNKDALARRRTEISASLYAPSLGVAAGADVSASGPTAPPAASAAGPRDASKAAGAEGDFRARIELLRREMGEDWLTALSRGSVYMDEQPQPGEETPRQ